MPVHNIRTEDEFRQAIADNKIVIVDFFATECEGSKTLAPIFVEQSNRSDHKHFLFAKVDVDELSALAGESGVRDTPTFHLYKNGKKESESVEPGPQALLQFIADAQ
ncbi:Thioredoxin-like fold protein [Moelleriella libera RCEF 2490]|uniref:Thioredoxin-like fold protein n=1 Tax=Moelleriella libera RCEF 2490 TaxID=1081109 RepID=A0A167ZR99_9HYPO|nr:Thioredoxin-like fold protein [Moelleriella libera RCEF 2490]